MRGMWGSTRRRTSELEVAVAELHREVQFLREASGVAAATAEAAVTPFVTIEDGAEVAPGVRLIASREEHRVTLLKGAKIYPGSEIIGPVTIGRRSFINRGGFVQAQVSIGTSVAIGPFVRLVTTNHHPGAPSRRAGQVHTLPITIGDGVWIGASVTILGGVTVGEGSVIAAGSVVTKDVPAHCLVAGVPAQVKKELPA
jgi:acetyltransferase-like isoleucine patch superfamily enzyme